jgi:hypothetical protein
MNLNDMYPTTTLKSADFDEVGEMVLTIKKVEIKSIGTDENAETKPVISFNETDKEFVCNKTNASLIAGMYGDKNVDVAWVGKQITLHTEMTTFGGKPTPGIRVKQIDAKQANIDAFWKFAKEVMLLTPDEGRAILKENNNDFVAALKAIRESNDPTLVDTAKDLGGEEVTE